MVKIVKSITIRTAVIYSRFHGCQAIQTGSVRGEKNPLSAKNKSPIMHLGESYSFRDGCLRKRLIDNVFAFVHWLGGIS